MRYHRAAPLVKGHLERNASAKSTVPLFLWLGNGLGNRARWVQREHRGISSAQHLPQAYY